MDQKCHEWFCLSGNWTQNTEDEAFVPSSAQSDDSFQGDAEVVEEPALVDLTVEDEEGALEELPRVDTFADNQDSYKIVTMGDHKGTPLVDLYVNGDSRPKKLPRVDVHIDEENVETDEEQLDQEAPVPRPFDLDEENINPDKEQLEQEATVPKLEQTAENGWIVILQNPKVPYDQDADPAGLYGGREVDDRPSLLEFYHQDARTNGHFARMAPTKAELAAKTAAAMRAKRMIEVSRSEASKLQAAPTTSEGDATRKPGILKLRPPKGDVPSPPKRSYADVLTGISGTSAPSSKAHVLPSRPISNVSFSPGTKRENVKEKPKDNAYIENRTVVLDRKQIERNKGILTKGDDGGPLLRTKPVREWISDPTNRSRRILRITNPSVEADADNEQNIAKPSVEVDDDSDLEKAIAASLEQHEQDTQQNKPTEHKENIDPDMQKTLDASVALEIKANADFHNQFAEIHSSIAIMKEEVEEKKANINALIDASTADEEADLERAIWESMKESPDKKRKSSSQSLPGDGSSEECEKRMAERGWMTPKGGERRSCKRLASPKKVAGG